MFHTTTCFPVYLSYKLFIFCPTFRLIFSSRGRYRLPVTMAAEKFTVIKLHAHVLSLIQLEGAAFVLMN